MKGYQYKDYMTREERRRFVRNIKKQGHISVEEWLQKDFKTFRDFLGFSEVDLPFSWTFSGESFPYWYKISLRTSPIV